MDGSVTPQPTLGHVRPDVKLSAPGRRAASTFLAATFAALALALRLSGSDAGHFLTLVCPAPARALRSKALGATSDTFADVINNRGPQKLRHRHGRQASPCKTRAIQAANTEAEVAQPAEPLAACELAIASLSEEWQDEARRCWSVGPDGVVPGFIAELMRTDVAFDIPNKKYVEVGSINRMMERSWKRFPGKAEPAPHLPVHTHEDKFIFYHSQKLNGDSPDARRDDYNMVMAYFQKTPSTSKGGIALDLGCGDGFVTRQFALSGKFDVVLGMDISWKQLEATRRAAEMERLGPEQGLLLGHGDAQTLPFDGAQVDFVWWGLGLHVVESPSAALSAIFAAMRPGGRIVLTTPAQHFSGERLGKLFAEVGFVSVRLRVPRPSMFMMQAVRP